MCGMGQPQAAKLSSAVLLRLPETDLARQCKVCISQVLLGSEGFKRQPGRESSQELLDLGARAQRDSSLEISALHSFTPVH